jgi:hypothetical protein
MITAAIVSGPSNSTRRSTSSAQVPLQRSASAQ